MLSSKSKQGPSVAVVGAAESPIGQHLARVLARGDYFPLIGDVRGLVDQSLQQPLRPVLTFLATQGMHPVPVNYNEVASIESALRETQWMLLVPPMNQSSPQSCVQEAQRIVSAAKKAGVQAIILASYTGCDAMPELKWLSAFKEIERVVKDVFGQQTVVLRLGFPAQALRLAAHQVHTKKALELPIPSSQSFNPIDLDDVARIIAGIVNGSNSLEKSLQGQVLPVYGPNPVTGATIAQIITDTIRPVADMQVQWKEQVSRDEIAQRWCTEQRRALDLMIALPATDMIRGAAPNNKDASVWCNSLGPFNINAGFAGIVLDLCELAGEGKLVGNNTAAVTKLLDNQQLFPIKRSIRQTVVEWL